MLYKSKEMQIINRKINNSRDLSENKLLPLQLKNNFTGQNRSQENGILFLCSSLILQLQKLAKQKFTGSLLLKSNDGLSRKIYFRLGRLIWVTGEGYYIQEQWQRHIKLFFKYRSIAELSSLLKEDRKQYYTRLAEYFYYQKYSREKQNIINLITSIFGEIIFDLIQYEARDKEQLYWQIIPHEKLKNIVSLINTDLIRQKAIAEWEQWQAAGLSDFLPSFFPAIENLKIVKKSLNPEIISLIDGTKSLRFLADKSNLNLVYFTRCLTPLLEAKAISLNKLPSLKKVALKSIKPPKSFGSYLSDGLLATSFIKDKNSSLIFCVDDSQVFCRYMEKIISLTSYRFLSLQDSLKAISLIIKNSPNLIFLDLMMPVLDGYQLCAQIRKIPRFKDVPIVIITGKDSFVDRVKAKIVGATAFLSKPASSEEVLTLVERLLPVN